MGLSAVIVGIEKLAADERAQWRLWQLSNPLTQNPFFRLEFAEAVARHAPDCFVAKLFKDGVATGYFPFQCRGKTVYPIGAPMNDYHGVIGPSESALSLEVVAGLIPCRRMVVNSWVGQASTGLAETSCQVDLVDGYDAWLGSRLKGHGKYFKDKARSRRGLKANLGEVELKIGLKSPDLLDRLIDLKRSQFKRTGRHDIFGVAWTRDLLHDLLQTQGADGFGASLATLSAGGELLAIEYSLHGDNHYHFWFPAYLEAGARYSPGILLSMETMQALEPEGYRVFDYGFGGESYKKYFVNRYQTVREASVAPCSDKGSFGQLQSRLLRLAGPERAEKLATSIQRRWAIIEASEVSQRGRLKGVLLAAQRATTRMKAGES